MLLRTNYIPSRSPVTSFLVRVERPLAIAADLWPTNIAAHPTHSVADSPPSKLYNSTQ